MEPDQYTGQRDIFFENLGNRDLMEQNGELCRYEEHKVPHEIECLWKDELIRALFESIENDRRNAVGYMQKMSVVISSFKDFDAFRTLLDRSEKYIEDMEPLKRVMCAERLAELLYFFAQEERGIPSERLTGWIGSIEHILLDTLEACRKAPDNAYEKLCNKYRLPVKENYLQSRTEQKLGQLLLLRDVLKKSQPDGMPAPGTARPKPGN